MAFRPGGYRAGIAIELLIDVVGYLEETSRLKIPRLRKLEKPLLSLAKSQRAKGSNAGKHATIDQRRGFSGSVLIDNPGC